MFTSGFKIDFRSILQQKKAALFITIFGTLIPFGIGCITAKFLLETLLIPIQFDPDIFSLFLGTAFAIEALPVIAKILMDAQIIHTSMGMVIMASAILTDLIGWSFFAYITQSNDSPSLLAILGLLLFFLITLRIGKNGIIHFFKHIENTQHWPLTPITLSLCLCLMFTILSQTLSLHSCLGAFLSGILVKELLNNYPEIKEVIGQFILSFFSPLFFVSIGLKINFIESFNLSLVAIIFVLASISKIFSVLIGGYLAGLRGQKAMVVSITLNARGAMEIVFSTIALNLGIINNEIYVALVVMALLTSMISGIVIKKIIAQSHSSFILESVALNSR